MSIASSKRLHWLMIGLLGVMIAAPNGTIIKYVLGEANPVYFNMLRFGVVAAITTPILIKNRRFFNAKNLRYSVIAGIFMFVAVVSYVTAIKLSQASYVAIITLLSPIVFVVLSIKFDNGKLSRKALAGISLAALGALTVVALPVAIHQNQPFIFYPAATALALVNCISFPLAILAYKRADDHGVPRMAGFSISAWVICLISLLSLLITRPSITAPTTKLWLGVLYSGIMVALISRIISIRTYEKLGATTRSALDYLETLAAIMIPVLILSESLSVEMVIGGMLILAGLYIIEHRSNTHHGHHLRIRPH